MNMRFNDLHYPSKYVLQVWSRHMNFVQFKTGSYKDEKYAKGHFPTHLLIGFDSPFTKRGAQTSVRRAFFKGSEEREREKNHLHERRAGVQGFPTFSWWFYQVKCGGRNPQVWRCLCFLQLIYFACVCLRISWTKTQTLLNLGICPCPASVYVVECSLNDAYFDHYLV